MLDGNFERLMANMNNQPNRLSFAITLHDTTPAADGPLRLGRMYPAIAPQAIASRGFVT